MLSAILAVLALAGMCLLHAFPDFPPRILL